MNKERLPRTIEEALARIRTCESVSSITGQALLVSVTGHGKAWLFAHREELFRKEQAALFVTLLHRAAQGEPLAQLVGEREFYGLPFSVTGDVLIPRPETEQLVDLALAWINEKALLSPRIVDVGTGSGAIAVTLAYEFPGAKITAIDISADALTIARSNALRHDVSKQVQFVHGDLLTPVKGPFDVIIANLPYITTEELEALEVGRWEPHIALHGGVDGLDLVRRLLGQAPARLTVPGILLLEIGQQQKAQVASLCEDAFPAGNISVLPDLAKLDRIVRVEVI